MSNPYWPEAKEISVTLPSDTFPDTVAIRFFYDTENIAPANEISSVINLDQMKFLRDILSKYIYEIEHGVPEDERHLLN